MALIEEVGIQPEVVSWPELGLGPLAVVVEPASPVVAEEAELMAPAEAKAEDGHAVLAYRVGVELPKAVVLDVVFEPHWEVPVGPPHQNPGLLTGIY